MSNFSKVMNTDIASFYCTLASLQLRGVYTMIHVRRTCAPHMCDDCVRRTCALFSACLKQRTCTPYMYHSVNTLLIAQTYAQSQMNRAWREKCTDHQYSSVGISRLRYIAIPSLLILRYICDTGIRHIPSLHWAHRSINNTY